MLAVGSVDSAAGVKTGAGRMRRVIEVWPHLCTILF